MVKGTLDTVTDQDGHLHQRLSGGVFLAAWFLQSLQALGLKKDMSLFSDDMSQAIELDNRSVLPPYTSDKAFPDNANYGYPMCDLSFVVEGQWAEFPYLWRIKIFLILGGISALPVQVT